MASKKSLPLAIALTLALAGMAIYVLNQFDDDSSRGARRRRQMLALAVNPAFSTQYLIRNSTWLLVII